MSLPNFEKKFNEMQDLEKQVNKNTTDLASKILKTIQRIDNPKESSIASSKNFSQVATIKNETNFTRYAIIMTNIMFDKNSVGDRGIQISNVTLTTDFASSVVKSSSDNSTRLNVVYLARFTPNEELSVNIFQNSGGDLHYELIVKTLFFDNL